MPDETPQLDDLDADGMARLYGGIVTLSHEAALSLGSMEGHQHELHVPPPAATTRTGIIEGYLAAAAVAALAYAMHYLPFAPFELTTSTGDSRRPIGAAIIAIVLGVVVANVVKLPKNVVAGGKDVVKRMIPYAIVCIGAGLNLTAIAEAGPVPLLIILTAVAFAYIVSYLIGRALGLSHKTAALLGVGTGVCGSSAIVAAAPLIDAEDQDLVLSVGTVNLLGLVTMLLLPAVAPLLSINAERFGVWCGASIHAVPQVLAAGDAYFKGGDLAVESVRWATLIKLGRVAMLAPLVFVLAVTHAKKTSAHGGHEDVVVKYHKLIPWFIWGFVIMAALGTLNLIPELTFKNGESLALTEALHFVGKLLLTFAMAAIGLGVNLRLLIGVGSRAVLAGALGSLLLALATLGMVYALM